LTRTLSREELTAALAARQGLIEPFSMSAAEAVRALTPLQGQHAPAPFIALAARLEGFTREALEAALDAGDVVKTTIMRLTLHLAAAEDYPAYHQFARQAKLRAFRKTYAHLDEAAVTAELREWLAEPRTNAEIRERAGAYEGVKANPWAPILFARLLVPLVQLAPAGHFDDRGRGARFVADPRPDPPPEEAAELVVRRYLAAFGPASRRDIAAWAGVAQRDFAAALERIDTVAYRDPKDVELLDLPGAPLPDAGTPLPPRLLAHWDQTLLAYADRDRILPPELASHGYTLSGEPTFTVDGRVAGTWTLDGVLRPQIDLPRAVRTDLERRLKGTVPFMKGARGGAPGPP
jgi:hypothetical protein